MNPAEQFRTWAMEKQRTNDELFAVELLVETAEELARRKANQFSNDFEAQREIRKRRALNPAYRPVLSAEQIELVAASAAEIRSVTNLMGLEEDRPVRSLAALAFFPQLTTIELRTELRDVSPLTRFPGLRKLRLRDDTLIDASPLAQIATLEELHLDLHRAWPTLGRLERLRKLRVLWYDGNLLVWRDVPELAHVERATFHRGFHTNTPLRNATELPAMPAIQSLHVTGIAALGGLERYAAVRDLELEGPFEDLEPLAALGEVRKLKLAGEHYFDLRPVARMARLRSLNLWRYRGLDVAPLADAPALRQVEAPLTDVIRTELGSLNAAVGFIDDSVFVTTEPPKRRFRYIAVDSSRSDYKQAEKKITPRQAAREPVFGDDPLAGPAEQKWFARVATERLDGLLAPGWGKVEAWQPGYATVMVTRVEEIVRLREIVLAVHDLMAEARFPWSVMIEVGANPDFYDDEFEAAATREDEEEDFESEREQWQEDQARWREYKAFLEREHRHRLQEQEGMPIDPQAFAPPPPPAPATRAADEPREEAGAGGLGDDFYLRLDLTPEAAWVEQAEEERAAYFLEVKFENWHTLPEPVEKRPVRN